MWETTKDVYRYDPRYSEQSRKDQPQVSIDDSFPLADQSDLKQCLMKDT